ncbi:hypothetical protein ACFPQC_01855, partial [Kibdelosporangium philippinense]
HLGRRAARADAVLQDALFPNVVNTARRRALDGASRRVAAGTVWTRDAPLPYPGRVSWASRGVTVASSTSESATEQVKFSAPAGGGQLIFARLDWPDTARPSTVRRPRFATATLGLITIDVPAGEHTLSLDYETPGLRLGVTLLGGATLVVLIRPCGGGEPPGAAPTRRRRKTLRTASPRTLPRY